MKHNSENTNAFLIHISALAGFVFPFGSIILPLVLWQSLKERSQFLDDQGKEAVNFNISYALYIFIIIITGIPYFLSKIFRNHWDFDDYHWNMDIDLGIGNVFGLFAFGSLAGIIGLIQLALIILAAIKTNNGESYKYPFTIKFIK
jgi:hypothetical protein